MGDDGLSGWLDNQFIYPLQFFLKAKSTCALLPGSRSFAVGFELMQSLRTFLSDAHALGLRGVRELVDLPVEDPLLDERLTRIRAQVIASLALRKMLGDMGFDLPPGLDLRPLVDVASANRILNRREAGILYHLNELANEAKHELVFRPRL